jgi:membrane protein implicated in regulation of membrane protease activity
MSGLYIFFLAVGAPLLLWMTFAGDADGGDGGFEIDGDGPLGTIPLSAIAFFMTAFGAVGLAGNLTGVGDGTAFVVAAIMAILAAVGSRYAFRWLSVSSTSSEVMNAELEGQIAKAALPITSRHRGKIIVEIAGAREQMTATPADGSTIEIGDTVVIVKIEKGVAVVAPFGPGLALE